MRKRVLILAIAVIAPLGVYVGCEDGGGSSGPTGTFDAGGTGTFDGSSPHDSAVDVQVAPTDAGADADADAAVSISGCADGTREGLSPDTYPKVAACGGVWTGDVSNALPLCGTGWHVCDGSEPALTAVQYTDGIAVVGCFAINAAQDFNTCNHGCAAAVEAGVDTAPNIDMGALGSTCPYQLNGSASCITGGRIDFSENSGTGCDFVGGANGLTGAVCCEN